MNFRVLTYFVAVANLRNFSRAAESLHVAQSTLSHQIQQLEEYYGVPLFNRSSRTVEMTPAGEALLYSAVRLLSEQDMLKQQLRLLSDDSDRKMLPLSIFIDSSILQHKYVLSDLHHALSQFRTLNGGEYVPQISFTVRDLNPAQDLRADQYDFWLLGAERKGKEDEIAITELYDDPYAMLMTTGFPRYREDLSQEELLDIVTTNTLFLTHRRSLFMTDVIECLPGGMRAVPMLRFEENEEVVLMYVTEGLGVTIGPSNQISPLTNGVDVCEFPIHGSHFLTVAGYRRDDENPMPRLLADFMKNLADSRRLAGRTKN